MQYITKALISGLLFLGSGVHAMEEGTKISFSCSQYESGKPFTGTLDKSLKELIENKSPEHFVNVPAIAVYLARCKQANVSDSKDAYLVFTKTGAVFVHKTWIKNTKKGKA